MLCKNCGYDLSNIPSDMKICPKCGVPIGATADNSVAPSATPADGTAKPKSSRKNLTIAIVAIALVIILACVAIFVWPFHILGGDKSIDVKTNPLGAAYYGLSQIGKDKGGFDITVNAGGEDISLQLALGKDLKDSAFNVAYGSGDEKGRVIFINDSLAICDYGDVDNPENYYGYSGVVAGISDIIKTNVGIDLDINKIIKDGRIDEDWANKQSEKLAGLAAMAGSLAGADDTNTGAALSLLNYSDDYSILVNDFFYKKCDDKDISKKFVKDLKINSDGGNTTATFSFDTTEFAKAFTKYVGEVADDKAYLKKNDLKSKDVRALQGILEIGVTQLEKTGDAYNFDMAVTVHGKNLKELKITVNGEGISIKFDKIGGSDIDRAKLNKIISGAEISPMDELFSSDYEYDDEDIDEDIIGGSDEQEIVI